MVAVVCLLVLVVRGAGSYDDTRALDARLLAREQDMDARVTALEHELERQRAATAALQAEAAALLSQRAMPRRAIVDSPGPPGPDHPASTYVPATDAHPHRQLTSPPAAVIDLDTQGTLSAFSSPSGTGGVLEISAAS